ncbi:hypothetical protein Vadar_031685 [Vaccinium darrowii]|uniref:Uncharacterized protein n=1 Tax=Vaccinium darrowii TaxID=229202 RepID=A0ACB7YAE1_9ERIC|nr:hypothetical protein Vadar_031685 [Vaccinium darrowii]
MGHDDVKALKKAMNWLVLGVKLKYRSAFTSARQLEDIKRVASKLGISIPSDARNYVLSDPDTSHILSNPDTSQKHDRVAAKHQHDHLKVVELVGFMGHETELELASHLLEIAVSLDKMIINPRRLISLSNRVLELFVDIEALQRARKRARQLEAKLPPKVDLVVL